MSAGRHIIRALLRTGIASTIGRVRSSTNGDCSRAFWLAPVRAGFGDGLAVGVLAVGVVEADQPRRLPAAVRAPGSGSHAEDRGAGPVLGLDVQIRNSRWKCPSIGLICEEAVQRGDGVPEAPALVLHDVCKVIKVTRYPECLRRSGPGQEDKTGDQGECCQQ